MGKGKDGNLEIQQLECFLAVCEEGGFHRATTRLQLTQPALSYQIKQLELNLGTALFYRRPKGVQLTEAGRALYPQAQEVLAAVTRARRAVEETTEGLAGEVRIGTVNSVGIHLLPEVLWEMREKYPKVRPTVLYRHSDEILEALLTDRIDLAVIANPPPDRRLRHETILTEQVSLVCGRSHPFYEQPAVKPRDLSGSAFVSLTSANPTGRLIREHLHRLGIHVEPVVSTEHAETVKKMVEIGLGVAFLPDMVTRLETAEGLLRRIDVGPSLTRSIVLVSWKRRPVSRAVGCFVDDLRAHAVRWKKAEQTV